MRKAKLALCFLLLFALTGAIGYYGYTALGWRLNYPDKNIYPVRGLDVSHHQGRINWQRVPLSDYQFVYIKATEGGDFLDPDFTTNWKVAKQAGFVVGAYHFFTLCRSGEEQAALFNKTVPKEQGTLPPVVDVEFGGNCAARPDKQKLIKELDGFLVAVSARFGVKPILYTTHDFYEVYFADAAADQYLLWIRDIFTQPAKPWVLWQYANNARVEGIDTKVDLNAFSGSRQEFDRLLQ